MAYMGSIEPGCEVGVRLLASARNKAAASLGAVLVDGKIVPGPPSLVIASGSSRALSIPAGSTGVLRIHAAFADVTDAGELEVRINGVVRDTALVRGEVWWTYTVIAPGASTDSIDHAIGAAYWATDSRRMPRGPEGDYRTAGPLISA